MMHFKSKKQQAAVMARLREMGAYQDYHRRMHSRRPLSNKEASAARRRIVKNFVSEEQRKKVMAKLKEEGKYDPLRDPQSPEYKQKLKEKIEEKKDVLYSKSEDLTEMSEDERKALMPSYDVHQKNARKTGVEAYEAAVNEYRRKHSVEHNQILNRASKKAKTYFTEHHINPTGKQIIAKMDEYLEQDPEARRVSEECERYAKAKGDAAFLKAVEKAAARIRQKTEHKIAGQAVKELRDQEYKDEELEKELPPKPSEPLFVPRETSQTESPAAKAKRLAREAEAKDDSKRFKKGNR